MKRILFAQNAGSTLSVLCLLIAGCANIQRTGASGYANNSSPARSAREDRATQRFEAAAERLGYDDPSSLSSRERGQVRLRTKVDRAEQYLEGQREREQYFKNKPYMRNDQERLAFLRLPDYDTRERWLAAHNVSGPSTPNPPEIQNLIDQNDLAIGMTKQAVRDSWGEPESIEVAGNPMYNNERWLYTEQVASTDGYRSEKRWITFESGHVVGWETH